MDRRSVVFSWTAPFSLDITDVDPDILYYTIKIIRLGGDSVATVNTTETQYVLQPERCNTLIHVYEVEIAIAAVNVVGVGEKYFSPQLRLEGDTFEHNYIT